MENGNLYWTIDNRSGPLDTWSGTIDKENGTRDFVQFVYNVYFLGQMNIWSGLKVLGIFVRMNIFVLKYSNIQIY